MGHVFQVNLRRTAQVRHGIEFSASRFKFASHTTEPSGCLFGRSVLEFWNATENERIVYIYIYTNIYYYYIYILCYVLGKATVTERRESKCPEIVEKKEIQNFMAKR